MSGIVVSEQSQRSLAYLDSLVVDNKVNSYVDAIMSAEGAPLIRLTLATIARMQSSDASYVHDASVEKLSNMLIDLHLTGQDDSLVASVEYLGSDPNTLRLVLSNIISCFIDF